MFWLRKFKNEFIITTFIWRPVYNELLVLSRSITLFMQYLFISQRKTPLESY